MNNDGAARRYAQAIMTIAEEHGNFEQWLRDLDEIARTFTDERIRLLLDNPELVRERKYQTVRTLLGARVQPLALNYALLLVRNHRVELAAQIAAMLGSEMRERERTAVATVTTAQPLDPLSADLIRQLLERRFQRGVEMRTLVDPFILGGFVARVGDRVVDGSVRARLRQMRKALVSG